MKNLLLTITIFLVFINCAAQEKYQKPITHDRQEGEHLGWSSSVYGDYAAAGAPHHFVTLEDDTIKDAGAVYIFNKDQQGVWKQSQRIVCNTPKSSDWFGTAVSITENYLAVGANGFDKVENNSDDQIREGAIFLYKKGINGAWQFFQTISIPEGAEKDSFGKHLSLYEDKLIVSAPFYQRENNTYPKSSSGSVFIYQLNSLDKWELKNQLMSKENTKRFGSAVSIHNNIVLIASSEEEKVYLYELDTELKVIYEQVFTNPNASIMNFACSVSSTDNYLFIGAQGEEDYKFYNIETKPTTDSVFVLESLTSTEDGFIFTQKLIPNIKSSLDSVNISKEQFRKEAILFETWKQREERKAGAGIVYVYKKGKDSQWELVQELVANDRGADDHFGMSLSADDRLLVVGAFGDHLEIAEPKEGRYYGAAYIFQLNEAGKWVEIKKLTSTQNKQWLKFGFSVDTDGKQAIIGSRFEHLSDDKSGGGVYFWER